MDYKDAADWTKHFDTLLWQVTSIFIAIVGSLLVYSYSNFHIPIVISGLFLTIVPIYFGASFRELRKRMSNKLDPELKEILGKGRKLYQWQLFILIFVVIEFLWMLLLLIKLPEYFLLWIILTLVVIAMTIKLSSLGKTTIDSEDI